MIKIAATFLMLAGTVPADADTILAARTIRSQAILTMADIVKTEGDTPGTYMFLDEVVGQEARVVLYAGRPIRIDDIGPPAIVERNQIVTLFYRVGSLTITTEARSLGRAGVGDLLRVMNLTSRNTVTGIVRPDGTISVGGPAIPPSS